MITAQFKKKTVVDSFVLYNKNGSRDFAPALGTLPNKNNNNNGNFLLDINDIQYNTLINLT